jgi:hypothetical protein
LTVTTGSPTDFLLSKYIEKVNSASKKDLAKIGEVSSDIHTVKFFKENFGIFFYALCSTLCRKLLHLANVMWLIVYNHY